MQCEDCKLKNECLSCGTKGIEDNHLICADYISTSPMPIHTHPLFIPLFRSRNEVVDGGSDNMFSNVDNSTRQRD